MTQGLSGNKDILPQKEAPTHPVGNLAVEQSWQRCLSYYQLDPAQGWTPDILSGAEFRHISGRSAIFLKSAMGEMQRLFDLVQGMGLMVLLADASSTLLARCVDETHLSVCRRLHLRKGAIWSEASAGTNGIGTCIEEKQPVLLGQGDHWRFCFSLLASYAVPIFDAQGSVVGALNLAAMTGNTTRPYAGLLMETLKLSSRRIEENLFRGRHPGAQIVSLGIAEACSAPLVALNREGEVVGATYGARAFMGWTDDMVWARPNLLAELETGEEISFRKAEESVVRSALAATLGNVSAAAQSLNISRATLYRKMKALNLQ